ncbi:MAG: endolytic transglycosylase MltG [Salinivirgaceae bacterium]|nr:MAG: endolytic transglycosylase MltG [Salinivirgaceae bacterium]
MKRILFIIILIIVIAGGLSGYLAWKFVYQPNTAIQKEISFYIRHTDDYESIKSKLVEQNIVEDIETFDWVAQKMNLPNHIYSGRYLIRPNLNNRNLIELLRSGQQTPIRITFNNIRTKEQLALRLSEEIEPDSAEIAELLFNSAIAKKYGFDSESFLCMFIPNTYEVYWDISTTQLFDRMHKEYTRFWTEEKKSKAKSMKLTPVEISILASIVQKESSFIEEYPEIAGVYYNRLKRGMKLQADPTVVYAAGDFTIKRVLLKHLAIDSPYNTYKYKGLPPGPISLPTIQAINSVLNKKSHKYFYFCAKDDFSGKHVFSKTHRQHIENANRYRRALNKRKIYE